MAREFDEIEEIFETPVQKRRNIKFGYSENSADSIVACLADAIRFPVENKKKNQSGLTDFDKSEPPQTEPLDEEYSYEIYSVVQKFRPYYSSLAKNQHFDADDIAQALHLKFINKSSIEPDWWKKIENKDAYVKNVARNQSFDLRRKTRNLISLDDEENLSIRENLSDDGQSLSTLNEKLDQEKVQDLMKELTSCFSNYEQRILSLNFFEGCKPTQIAELLGKEAAFVQIDVNRVKAAFRARLKRHLKANF